MKTMTTRKVFLSLRCIAQAKRRATLAKRATQANDAYAAHCIEACNAALQASYQKEQDLMRACWALHSAGLSASALVPAFHDVRAQQSAAYAAWVKAARLAH